MPFMLEQATPAGVTMIEPAVRNIARGETSRQILVGRSSRVGAADCASRTILMPRRIAIGKALDKPGETGAARQPS